MSTKNRIQKVNRKSYKISFFIKNGKKVLTNDKKHAKIVNCIIIAHTVYSLTKPDKLHGSNLHKKRCCKRKNAAAYETIPERYQFFEWSD